MQSPLLIFFLVVPASVVGQGNPDSHEAMPSAEERYAKVKVDSVPAVAKFKFEFHYVDSIRSVFNNKADSLQILYKGKVGEIDTREIILKNGIDSLRKLKLFDKRLTNALDSVRTLRLSTFNKFTSKLDSLKAKTTSRLNELDLPAEYMGPVQELKRNMELLDLSSGAIKIPPLDLPGVSIPANSDLADVGLNVAEAGQVGELVNLPIEAPAGELGELTQQTAVYKEDIKNITQGDLSDVQALPETIEAQASKIEGIEELQKQSGALDEYKNKLEVIRETNAAKEKTVAMAKEVAIDHFAGKQEQLRTAMEKISKYKQKYSSVSSLKDLAKRAPNPMKEKPFIDRLVPGLYLQYQQTNSYLIDINPYVGYKINRRLISGFGWNHRYAYEGKTHKWSDRLIIFGPRGYVDFKLGKGFIAHLEGESMNTFVPSTLIGNPDTGYREWVWSFMTGLKKEYKIYKNLKGTALIQYNLFNRYYKAPYVDRLISRVGLEYALKKRKTKKSKT